MVRISPYLSVKNNKAVIMLNIAMNGFRIQISSGVSINPANFSKRTKRISTREKNHFEKNAQIDKKISSITRFVNRVEEEHGIGSLSRHQLKTFLNKKQSDFTTFIEYTENLLKRFATGEALTQRGNRFNSNTLKTYNQLYQNLVGFEKDQQIQILFNDINEPFFLSLIRYLNTLNLSTGYIHSHIKFIKTICSYAYIEKINTSMDYKFFSFENKVASKIVLTTQELEKLEELELSGKTEKLLWSKYYFLIQCYTGLRQSDIMKLSPMNVDMENREIRLTTQKTSEEVTIPIVSKLFKIFLKHPIESIQFRSKARYHLNIKKLCQLAGISEDIKITKYIAGAKKEEIIPKYELVSSHTARRTFITLSLKLGILPETVMKVTGHKSRQSFQKYVKIAESDVKEAFKAWD